METVTPDAIERLNRRNECVGRELPAVYVQVISRPNTLILFNCRSQAVLNVLEWLPVVTLPVPRGIVVGR